MKTTLIFALIAIARAPLERVTAAISPTGHAAATKQETAKPTGKQS